MKAICVIAVIVLLLGTFGIWTIYDDLKNVEYKPVYKPYKSRDNGGKRSPKYTALIKELLHRMGLWSWSLFYFDMDLRGNSQSGQ